MSWSGNQTKKTAMLYVLSLKLLILFSDLFLQKP